MESVPKKVFVWVFANNIGSFVSSTLYASSIDIATRLKRRIKSESRRRSSHIFENFVEVSDDYGGRGERATQLFYLAR